MQFEVDAQLTRPPRRTCPPASRAHGRDLRHDQAALFAEGRQFTNLTEPVFGYAYVVTSGACEHWHHRPAGDTSDHRCVNHYTTD